MMPLRHRRRPPWSALWDSMYEPRWETGFVVTIYLLVGALGFVMIVAPPPLWWMAAPALHGVSAAVLTLAALIGAPTAWRGWWAVETVATWLWILGVTLVLIEIAAVEYQTGLVTPHITAVALVIVLLVGVVRLIRIRRRVWAPGRDPQMDPEERKQIRDAFEHRGRDR